MSRTALATVLCVAVALVGSCTSGRAVARTNNVHPYPRLFRLGGETYHALPVKITSAAVDPHHPTRVRLSLDLHRVLRQDHFECLSGHFDGGVRRSDASTVVIAVAVYARPLGHDITKLSLGSCFFALPRNAGKPPELTIRLASPLGARDVQDASTGRRVQVK